MIACDVWHGRSLVFRFGRLTLPSPFLLPFPFSPSPLALEVDPVSSLLPAPLPFAAALHPFPSLRSGPLIGGPGERCKHDI